MITRSGYVADLLELPTLLERGRHLLHVVAAHTGIPVVVVAALALVISYRVVRRTLGFALQVAFVLVLLVVATGLGWIHF